MSIRRTFPALAAASAGVLVAIALAQPPVNQAPGNPPDKTGKMPDVTAEMQKGMEAWMKTTQPVEAHALLKKLEGDWKTTVRLWTGGPGATPVETQGTATYRSIMGGRFVEMQSTATVMGMQVESRELLGFDNFRKQYVGTRVSSMGTEMLHFQGSPDKDGRVLTFYGTMDEPMTGEVAKTVRYVLKIDSDDKHTLSVQEAQYGEPFTVYEVMYERVK